MRLIDPAALICGLRFPLTYPAPVALGAMVYAAPFALQSVATQAAANAAPWGAPAALGLSLVAFLAFVAALAGWARPVLGQAGGRPEFGAAFGRLVWVIVLVAILLFTVLGTALLGVVFMLSALALIHVDAEAAPPEGFVDIFALYGPGESVVALVIGAIFTLFSVWFFARLALAYPASMAAGRVRVLSAWPLSGKRRAVAIGATTVLAAAPGLVALWLVNLASNAAFGAWPASAQSAEALAAPAFGLIAFLYGALKMALVGAPVAGALCALYATFEAEDADPATDGET